VSEATDRELEDEARALLRPAKDPLPAPTDVRARALRRLALAIPIDGGGGPGAPPAPGGAAPHAASGLGRALATRVPAWSLLVSFVAGGAVVMAARGPAPSDVARPRDVVAATAAALPASAPVMPAPPAAIPASASAAPTAPTASVTATARAAASSAPTMPISSPRAAADGALEAERALLDVARTALGRGDGGNALRAAEEHGRKFPRGILAEEREAMTIQALRLLHRDDEAEARLQRFRGRFPSSLMRPALEAADGGPP
jgi:hypothetical protein